MTDMHIHTTFSDGSDTIEQIWEYTRGYDLFSITDHNNIMSSKIMKADNYISGVELSVNGSDFGLSTDTEIHLVAYHYNPNDKRLNDLVDEFNYYNSLVYYKILIDIAIKHKLKIDFDFIQSLIDKNVTLNKVYLTRLLIQCGIGNELYDTYNRYVRKSLNTRYYYFKYKEILDVIKGSNGYILLAHPYSYDLGSKLDELIKKLSKLGIDGIEMDQNHYAKTMEYVKKYNFIYSVGSDYHGKVYSRCNKIGVSDELYNSDEKYLKNILLSKKVFH